MVCSPAGGCGNRPPSWKGCLLPEGGLCTPGGIGLLPGPRRISRSPLSGFLLFMESLASFFFLHSGSSQVPGKHS